MLHRETKAGHRSPKLRKVNRLAGFIGHIPESHSMPIKRRSDPVGWWVKAGDVPPALLIIPSQPEPVWRGHSAAPGTVPRVPELAKRNADDFLVGSTC